MTEDRWLVGTRLRTECENCLRVFILATVDPDGVLIGDQCPQCGYYVTRYMPGQDPLA